MMCELTSWFTSLVVINRKSLREALDLRTDKTFVTHFCHALLSGTFVTHFCQADLMVAMGLSGIIFYGARLCAKTMNLH